MALRAIFKDGVHRTPHPKKEWSVEDVDAVFANSVSHSPERIPLVIGHPQHDLPVVGFLARKTLQMIKDGDRRVIMVDDEEDATFAAEAIESARKSGHDKISVKIKLPEMYIKSIGLVPEAAVTELNDATFADEEQTEAFAVFEADAFFGTNEFRVPWIGSLFRRMREAWIERFGKDDADKVLPSHEIDWLMDSPSHDVDDKVSAAFGASPNGMGSADFSTTTTTKTGESTMTEEEKREFDQLKADNDRLKGLVDGQAKAERQRAIDAVFCAEENKGKVTEKNRPELQKIAESLYPLDATFGADADSLKPLKVMLETMPVLVQDGDVATADAAADSATFGADGNDPRAAYRKAAAEDLAKIKK